jgi:hypothetical protein
MNHLKQFADGLELGLRRFKREWFKVIDELGQDWFARFGIVAIAGIFLWPLLSCLAELVARYFQ